MLRTALRVGGALLALVGAAVTVAGVWFATQLGSAGTATFTLRPATTAPVVIGPDVLNRVAADVTVTATPGSGGTMWMAVANPSDAAAVLGASRRVEVTGVEVRGWRLTARTTGAEDPPQLGLADLWRRQDAAPGPVTLTVAQDGSPRTLVVASEDAQVESVVLGVTDKRWFVEAVVGALVGLFLVVAGVLLAWPRRRDTEAAPRPAATGEVPA